MSNTLWQEDELAELEVPAIPARCMYGDLWSLGGTHRLLCGDATNANDVLRLLNGDVAMIGLHDPPYGLRGGIKAGWDYWSGKHYGNAAATNNTFAPIRGDDKPFDPRHLLASGSIVVIWGANHFADKLPASHAWIIWDKRIDLPSNSLSDGEAAWVSTGNRLIILHHRWNGMIRDSEMGEQRVHPTQKPLWLMQQIINRYTQPGDLVTDWYAGSGTTLLACEFAKRRAACIEIEPHYCDVILARWEQATGKQASLISRTQLDTVAS